MSSKSKEVRLQQRRVFEKKLELRLQQLKQKGVDEEKAQSDPLVKKLNAKIRQTNFRITVFEKYVHQAEELAKAKAQKLVEGPVKKEKPLKAEPKVESKEKKKLVKAEVEAKPKPASEPVLSAEKMAAAAETEIPVSSRRTQPPKPEAAPQTVEPSAGKKTAGEEAKPIPEPQAKEKEIAAVKEKATRAPVKKEPKEKTNKEKATAAKPKTAVKKAESHKKQK